MTSLEFQNLNIKTNICITRNNSRVTIFAVGQSWRNNYCSCFSKLHILYHIIKTRNHLAGTCLKAQWVMSLWMKALGSIKQGSVYKVAQVIYCYIFTLANLVAVSWFCSLKVNTFFRLFAALGYFL